jgi:hypothetical protein
MVAYLLNSAYVFIKKDIEKELLSVMQCVMLQTESIFYISLYFLNSSMRHPNYNGLMSLGE